MEYKNLNLEFPMDVDPMNERSDILHRSQNCLIISNEPLQCISEEEEINLINTLPICCESKIHFHNDSEHTDHEFDDVENHSPFQTLQSDLMNTSSRQRVSSTLSADLGKYKEELKLYTHESKDLEEKCLQMKFELKEIEQKHNKFMMQRNTPSGDADPFSASSTTNSEISLQKKYTQVFHRGNSFMRIIPKKSQHEIHNSKHVQVEQQRKRHRRATSEKRHDPSKHKDAHNDFKENEPPNDFKNLRSICRALRSVIDVNGSNQQEQDVDILRTTINKMQREQDRFRGIIKQQQHCLDDYHTRCVQAQLIINKQQIEIEKLSSNNRQLENEIIADVDQLRLKMESKLREVAQLPQLLRTEQTKNERMTKENSLLNERIRSTQGEANHLKAKIDEIVRRRVNTMERFKTTERDLKIFKNYNATLKHEKRKLNEELQKLREHMNSVEMTNKRILNRQREQVEKQKRDLQKRVHDLEMKLSRCQNSTTTLIQERDSLISELQTQLNTLVHNFEISQKHIRVLRRHIYSMTAGDTRETIERNRILLQTA